MNMAESASGAGEPVHVAIVESPASRSAPATPIIEVANLTKRYGPVLAVDDLSFEVHAGETLALIGPNGAGKTTTLKILLGLARPDSGRVRMGREGLPPSDPRARRELGYVPQRVHFPAGRTVFEILSFFADLRGLDEPAVHAALDRVGLSTHASRHADQLSGGYMQRLSLSQALLGDPGVLVLDEPTASLDPEATWEFRKLIENLQHEGKTILLCSHLLSEVERVADRVLILVNGHCAGLERLDALRERQVGATRLLARVAQSATQATDLLERAGFDVQAVGDHVIAVEAANGQGLEALEALRHGGIEVKSFEQLRPTLEEIFIETVQGDRDEAR
jgi:ABC-type multidrug transport system ATPase subunit